MTGLSVKRDGTIYETSTKRVMKIRSDGRGYLCFDYRGKTYKAHIAVCTIKHGPRPSTNHIAGHKNDNKLDHRPHNVEWQTRGENVRRAHKAKVMKPNAPRPLIRIRDDGEKVWYNSSSEAGRFLGLSPGTIASAASGKSKTAAGFRWEYA